MTHDEFMRKVLEKDYTPAMLSRLAVEKLLVPASWCRMILEEIPEARDYLKQRSPEAMEQLEQAERQKADADK